MSAQITKSGRGLWDPQDLLRRLGNVLAIAERAVRLLAPLGYTDPNDATVGVTAEKVVTETALLLLACSSVVERHAELKLATHKVAELLIPYARNEQVVIGLCNRPGVALDLAFAHICLSRLGFPDARFESLLRLGMDTESARSKERLPHRILEQEWLKRVWGSSDTPPHPGRGIATQSMLGMSMDVFASNRDDIYAFTHAIMYWSDLGSRKVPLPRLRSQVLADAEAALAVCLDQQDYDLCGEILLAWPYLDASWSAAATFAFQVLARVEDVVGFLPTALTRVDRYEALSQEEKSRYALATIYHTAYVMGLLCAAGLRSGRIPPAMIPPARRRSQVDVLLKVIDGQDHKPHWRDDFSKLETKSQFALAPMLVTIALKRAVARRDLEQVRFLLAHSLTNGIVNYPATRQAADLLRRFTEAAGYSR